MTAARGWRILRTASAIGAGLVLLAASAAAKGRDPLKIPGAQYEPVNWSAIEGWADDDQGEAFVAFMQSCKVILQNDTPSGPMATGLYHVCQKAVEANPQKPGEARAFFERNFRPVRISPLGTPDGFVTGYYEPIVSGSRNKSDGYDYPLYRTPAGSVADGTDTGKKKKKHKRKSLASYDRASIDDGVLAGRGLEICWLHDPIDSFFIHIQGSVRVKLDDGNLMRLNYAAANGQPYYAVGRWLIDKGIVPKDEMSMDRIRQWMMRNPDEGRELRRKNKSYVFFRETSLTEDQEPVGAQGISLTPGRSIAVDRKLHTYGTPFFISGYLPIQSLKPDTWFRRLMIAQDTGGAIVGPARADLYFGAGDEAESVAGRMRHNARFVMLLPKEVDPAADSDEIPLPRPRPDIPVAEESPAEKPAVAVTPAEPEKKEALVVPLPPPAPVAPSVAPAVAAPEKIETKAAVPKAEPPAANKAAAVTPDKPAAKSEAKVEAKPEIKPVAKTGGKAIAKTDVKSAAKPEPKKDSKAKDAKTKETKTVAKPAKTKETKVAAKTAEPVKPPAKPEHAAETKPKQEKTTAKTASAKPASGKTKLDAWEARVMPVIPPETSAGASKKKK